MITPTPEFEDDDVETDFESEALIPTQEHHPRINVSVTESSVTLTVSRENNQEDTKNHHHRKNYSGHSKNHTHHHNHHNTQVSPVAPVEEGERPETNSTILDSLLARFFPEDIEIPHLFDIPRVPETDDELVDDVDDDQEHVDQLPSTTTPTKKPEGHKKNKNKTRTTIQTALPTQEPTTIRTVRIIREEEDVVSKTEEHTNPTRQMGVTKSILGGRVDITVQHLGTEIVREGTEQTGVVSGLGIKN